MPDVNVDRGEFKAYWYNRRRRKERIGELLVNGTFQFDLSGWTTTPTGTGAVATWDAGRAKVARIDASNFSKIQQSFTCEVGERYELVIRSSDASSILVRVGTAAGGAQTLAEQTVPGESKRVFTFIATQTTHHLQVHGGVDAADCFVEDVSIKKVV